MATCDMLLWRQLLSDNMVLLVPPMQQWERQQWQQRQRQRQQQQGQETQQEQQEEAAKGEGWRQ